MSTIDPSRVPLAGLDRLAKHLAFHTERQSVIAGNLANLDTPGYRAKDVNFTEELSAQVDAGGQETTTMSFSAETVTADDEVPDQDGNTVSLEGEMAKMSNNLLRYRSIAELLSRRIGMLRYAATDGST